MSYVSVSNVIPGFDAGSESSSESESYFSKLSAKLDEMLDAKAAGGTTPSLDEGITWAKQELFGCERSGVI